MKASSLAMSGLLVTAILLAGCERDKPGNPLPPRKPPMPKTIDEGPSVKPIPDAPVLPARGYRA